MRHFRIANIHNFLHILHMVTSAIFLGKKKIKAAFFASRTLTQNFEAETHLFRTQDS